MRPRSVTGPLILVAIGVVFLLNNMGHDVPLWRFIGDYWPFLLIGLGLIQLAEVLFHVSQGSPPPSRSGGGGGWFWLIMLCIFLAIWGANRDGFRGLTINSNNGFSFFRSEFDYPVEAHSSPDGVTRFVLDGVNGDLTIRGAEGGEVKVAGHKNIHAFSRNDADRADQSSQVHLQREGDSLVLRVDTPSHSGMLSISSDLDITVPKGLNLEARGRGDLSVEDMAGTVSVTDRQGDVRLSNIGKDVRVEGARGGLVRAENVKGTVDLQGRGGDVQLEHVDGAVTINGEFSGTLEFTALAKPLHFESSHSDFHVEQIPGTVTMDLGDLKIDNAVGPVKFRTGTRDVDVRDVANSLELDVNRGDIEISASKTPLPKMDVHSRNGDITLTLPDKAGFDLDGKTDNGEVDNEFGSPLENHSDGKTAWVKGRVGSGPVLTVVTDRGTLSVKKD
jgi:DUF4097 and DUF4098 domain-containing protein YvlB